MQRCVQRCRELQRCRCRAVSVELKRCKVQTRCKVAEVQQVQSAEVQWG